MQVLPVKNYQFKYKSSDKDYTPSIYSYPAFGISWSSLFGKKLTKRDLLQYQISQYDIQYILQQKYQRTLKKVFDILNNEDKKNFANIISNISNFNKTTWRYFCKLYQECCDEINGVKLANIFNHVFNHQKDKNIEKYDSLIKDNISDPYLWMYFGYVQDPTQEKINTLKKFLSKKCDIFFIIANAQKILESPQRLLSVLDKGIPKEYMFGFTDESIDIDGVLEIRNSAIQKIDILQEGEFEITEEDINEQFLSSPQDLSQTIKILGKNSLEYLFNLGLYTLSDYISEFGEIDVSTQNFQKLLQIINPTESDLYIENERKIKELKAKLKSGQGLKQQYIKEINSLTHLNKEMVKRSVKDPQQKFDIALVYYSLENNDELSKVLEHLNPQTVEEEKERNILLNDIYLKGLSPQGCERINFVNSKYIMKLFDTTQEFKDGMIKIIDALNKFPSKRIEDIFNKMKENKENRLLFNANHINYDKWVNFDPKSYIEENILLSSGSEAQIRVRKADMNNIEHSLFLGNHASCCTSVGTGCNAYTAPYYILNKMFSCIEVMDGDKFVGNTMVYFAKINKKLSLVLDNIELKPEYRNNDDIRSLIIKYAKQLLKEVGVPNAQIYAGPYEHKVNFDDYPIQKCKFRILGNNYKDLYIDALSSIKDFEEDTTFVGKMYKIT